MQSLYGPDWGNQLVARTAEEVGDAEDEEDEATVQTGAAPSQEPASAGAPQPPPPPTAMERPTTPRPGATEVSPGSGHMPISQLPGSPGTLHGRLQEPCYPRREPIEKYLDKINAWNEF